MLTGWYGLGSGLEAARREHGVELLREAATEWPFLDTLLSDVEMVLAKADLRDRRDVRAARARGVAGRLRRDPRRVRPDRGRRPGACAGTTELLDSDPTLQRSIRLRNPYVDPMNILQVDLLGRWRADDRPQGPLLDALLSTVNGIARGLQNTG